MLCYKNNYWREASVLKLRKSRVQFLESPDN